ncbi:hypothetical protein ACFTAO_00905 [Paenibacillus rhizoplanae]
MKDHWPEVFADLEVNVQSKVTIQSSAKTSRAIRLGGIKLWSFTWY